MYAEIIGWGKCAPPAILTNDDLSTVMDTNDEWIYSRSGIKRRHISHVPVSELSRVAAERALACSGLSAEDIDLVILGSNTPDSMVPNTASYITNSIGAINAAAFDMNSACTSFIYALNVATDMIKAGSIRTAVIIGMEKVSRLMDWGRRESCVLFGDGGGAVVLKASEKPTGLLFSKISNVPNTVELIELPEWGMDLPRSRMKELYPSLNFLGQDIFKNAVRGMLKNCEEALDKAGLTIDDIDLLIPHQANARILSALGKRLGISEDKVISRIEEYGNTSAGSIPLALCDALEAGRVKPGMTMLMPTFGAGLTSGAAIVQWGDKITPTAESDAQLPPCNETALELLADSLNAAKEHYKDQ
jgi:3-oxoacyl-[acyl-carrier-protein] synthase-3